MVFANFRAMRKIFVLLASVVFVATAAPAQNAAPAKDSVLPYLKYPKLPAFNILELDSTTIYNTYNIPEGKPVAIVYFDPNCKHCKASTGRLVKGMDSLRNVQFYFVTPVHSMSMTRTFYDTYHLGDLKNVKMVGRDYEFFFLSYYGVRNLPDVAIYDAKKKLVKLIDGEFSASDIYKYAH